MRRKRLHLIESCAERKRSEKGEAFNRIVKVGFLIQWRKPSFNQKKTIKRMQ